MKRVLALVTGAAFALSLLMGSGAYSASKGSHKMNACCVKKEACCKTKKKQACCANHSTKKS